MWGPLGPGSGTSRRSRVAESRSTRSVVRVPTRASSASSRPPQVVTGASSTATMRSPVSSCARAAGEAGSTAPTCIPSGWCVPATKRQVRKTTAVAQLPSGPAAKMARRRPGDRAPKETPEGFCDSCGFSPSSRSQPPKGRAPIDHRWPRARKAKSGGPMPKEKTTARVPNTRAAARCASSCTVTSPPRASSARSARMRCRRAYQAPPSQLEQHRCRSRRCVPRLASSE